MIKMFAKMIKTGIIRPAVEYAETILQEDSAEKIKIMAIDIAQDKLKIPSIIAIPLSDFIYRVLEYGVRKVLEDKRWINPDECPF